MSTAQPPFEPTAENGVITPKGNPYVHVTDLERTVIDCCDRIERAGGIEELLHCMEGISLLDEPKLEKYLALYNKAFLYQKVGFILEHSKEHHHISDRKRLRVYTIVVFSFIRTFAPSF